MYFAVTKLCFDLDNNTVRDSKELASLCERIRKKFKVTASPCPLEKTQASIAIVTLQRAEQKISKLLDDISEFCETCGFGRVSQEHTLIDTIDSISEFDDGEESGSYYE